jgi:hypothetical protein
MSDVLKVKIHAHWTVMEVDVDIGENWTASVIPKIKCE